MTKSILILTLALACSTPAIAQSSESVIAQASRSAIAQASNGPPQLHYKDWEGSFFAGYAFHNDYTFRTVVAGSDGESPGIVEMHYRSSYRLGARATQYFGDFFGASLEYSFSDQPLRLTNVTPRAPSLEMSHFVHSLFYNVSFSPRTRDKRFRPHVELGVGALLFYISEDSKREALARDMGLGDSWELGFSWGAGFKQIVAERFAITADVKGRVSDIPTYGLPTASRFVDGQYQPAISAHGLMHAWQFNIGFAHQWDSW